MLENTKYVINEMIDLNENNVDLIHKNLMNIKFKQVNKGFEEVEQLLKSKDEEIDLLTSVREAQREMISKLQKENTALKDRIKHLELCLKPIGIFDKGIPNVVTSA